MNSAILPFLAPLVFGSEGDYYQVFVKSGGIIDTALINWVVLAFVPPITEIFHIKYLWYLIKTHMLRKKGDKNFITQIEANEYKLLKTNVIGNLSLQKSTLQRNMENISL